MRKSRNKTKMIIIIAVITILIVLIGFYKYRKIKFGDNWFIVENHIYTVYYRGHYYHQISENEIPADLLSDGWDYTRDTLILKNSVLDYFTPDIVKPHVFVLTNEKEQGNNIFLRTSLGGDSFRYFRKEDE